jgi:type VI secretion system protein ImpA
MSYRISHHQDEFNFSELLVPISMDNPVGNNLRKNMTHDSLYFNLKDKRNKIRAKERENIDEENISSDLIKEWNEIYEISITLLTTQTKDLEIATWLIESLLRLRGFKGLGDGFNLFIQLVEKYWPSIYPENETDEENNHSKLNALSGLNGTISQGTLISPLYCLSLTPKDFSPISAWNYDQIEISLREKTALEAGNPFAKTLIDNIEYAIDSYKKLVLFLEKSCGLMDAPPSSRILEALNACLDTAKKLYHKLLVQNQTISSEKNLEVIDKHSSSVFISEREDAFQQLQQIAEYFKRVEPHSPVSYLIERAVEWGRLSLPELLSLIIQDGQALDYSYQLLGVSKTVT